MRLRRAVSLTAGVVLACFAALLPNSAIEQVLLGRSPGELAWGPALLRVLLACGAAVLAFSGFARAARPGQDTRPDAHAEPRLWFAVFTLMAVALGLRLWGLNSCLWYDEVLTLVDFVRPPLGRIFTSFPSQNQHMLYSILAHLSTGALGESAWALRLPAVLFGVASVGALYLLGRLVIGAREALMACALMTVSYHHIWFSQNARGYTGLLLATLLATWLWLEALRRDRWWNWYAAAVFVGLTIHLTMAFVVAAHVLIYAATLAVAKKAPESRWRPCRAWLLSALLTLAFYAVSLPEFFRTALHEVSMESQWTNPMWVVREALGSLPFGWLGAAGIVFGLTLAGAGWWSIARQSPQAAAAMLLPPLLGGVTMLALRHNLWPRFFFFAMGFGLLALVAGAMALMGWLVPLLRPAGSPKLARSAGFALAGVITVASAATVMRVYSMPKQDFTGARDYVDGHRKADELVVAVGLAARAYRQYFAPHWRTADTAAELEWLQRNHSGLWLVYTIPTELEAYHAGIWRLVRKHFRVIQVFPGTLGGGEIYVCREGNEEGS